MANLIVRDFDTFYMCLEYASFIADDLIIDINETQTIINMKNNIARLSIETTSMTASEPIQIALSNIKLFLVALKNAQSSIKEPIIDKICIDVSKTKLIIKTNNSKTSIHQSSIDIISSKSAAFKSIPPSAIDFTIFKDSFRKINSSLIYIPNTEDARIELNKLFEDRGSTNSMMAKIFAANTPLSNYSIIDVGQIKTINEEIPYKIVLDFERIALLSKFVSANQDSNLSALKIPALLLTHQIANNTSVHTSIFFVCSILKYD